MFLLNCDAKQVKQTIYLADKMKSPTNSPEEFREKLLNEKIELFKGDYKKLVNDYFDNHKIREKMIGEKKWFLGVVELDKCETWENFGGRPGFPQQSVSKTTELFKKKNVFTDRIWNMVQHIQLFNPLLPIIVILESYEPLRYKIDDGSNRAVAMYLGGVRNAIAFIGIDANQETNLKKLFGDSF